MTHRAIIISIFFLIYPYNIRIIIDRGLGKGDDMKDKSGSSPSKGEILSEIDRKDLVEFFLLLMEFDLKVGQQEKEYGPEETRQEAP